MKKALCFVLLSGIMLISSAPLFAERGNTVVGGSLSFYVFDTIDYEKGGTDVKPQSRISTFWLYFSKKLSDRFSVTVEPVFYGSTGASPKPPTAMPTASDYVTKTYNPITNTFTESLGPLALRLGALQFTDPARYAAVNKQITAMNNAGFSEKLSNPFKEILLFKRATLDVVLPWSLELSAGRLAPLLLEDYGYYLFWHEDYNGSMVTINPVSGYWNDVGIELYRNFEVGEVSLPVHFYLLNGMYLQSDNNGSQAYALHIAPEFGNLKLMGSAYTGKWDWYDENNQTRYAGGFSYKLGKFAIRSEYTTAKWENVVHLKELVVRDINSSGYYAKLFYTVNPWLTAILRYDVLDNDFSGFYWPIDSVGEKYTTIAPVLNFKISDSANLMLAYNIGDWKRNDGTSDVKYSRLFLSSRITF